MAREVGHERAGGEPVVGSSATPKAGANIRVLQPRPARAKQLCRMRVSGKEQSGLIDGKVVTCARSAFGS